MPSLHIPEESQGPNRPPLPLTDQVPPPLTAHLGHSSSPPFSLDDALSKLSKHSLDARRPMTDSSVPGPRPSSNDPGHVLPPSFHPSMPPAAALQDILEAAPALASSAASSHETLVGDDDNNSASKRATRPLPATNRDDGSKKVPPPKKQAAKSDAQRQLNQYRESLARDLERRELPVKGGSLSAAGAGVSSARHSSIISPDPSSEPASSSTESGGTARPGPGSAPASENSSYAFPHMATPGSPSSSRRPFTAPRSTANTPALNDALHPESFRLQAKPFPDNERDSIMSFSAGGHTQSSGPSEFPSPSLYDLTLMLSAEPGLDAWWSTVVQIMSEIYKAERVTLSIPADSTDIENVPWGQRATYNAHEDNLSLGYMARGSSAIPSSSEDPSETVSPAAKSEDISRPYLIARHSFTAYEDKKEKTTPRKRALMNRRPDLLPRSRSLYPTSPAEPNRAKNEKEKEKEKLNENSIDRQEQQTQQQQQQQQQQRQLQQERLFQEALEQHDFTQEPLDIPGWESSLIPQEQDKGKVLDVLQALDYEADPLIDHNGVRRVIERGKVIALTRNYPYLDPGSKDRSSGVKNNTRTKQPSSESSAARRNLRSPRHESNPSLLSQFGGAKLPSSSTGGGKKAVGTVDAVDADNPRPTTPKYEEYEQPPPSPWSQSPAPSPAVRADPTENPFFTDAVVDEESFNPSSTPQDYSALVPPEAIGIDNSWTVLHIPLSHVLLSKPSPAFKLNNALMTQRASSIGSKAESKAKTREPGLSASLHHASTPKQKHAPIAILSILSPIIPYPTNLRLSLEKLAPHLATSFSLCRHYSNLEVELNGLHKRKPSNVGFGAVAQDGRPLADASALANLGYLPAEDALSRSSLAGSITSPSDYSAPSRSIAGSPGGTPTWDPASLGLVVDKRPSASSPYPTGGDSYFNANPRPGTAGVAQPRRKGSKEGVGGERRASLRLSGGRSPFQEAAVATAGIVDDGKGDFGEPPAPNSPLARRSSVPDAERTESQQVVTSEGRPVGVSIPMLTTEKRVTSTPSLGYHHQRHSQLHSYGADFASTFQSLTPSSIITIKGLSQPQALSRGSPIPTTQTEMTPPSDRLKSLILDSLPAHVFVALPQTGAIVWVNSRFLTYRGQTSSDMAVDPWGSIHPDDREEYLRAWSHSVRTGGQFSRTVRIRRFDGIYRWFYARAVASKDRRGVILQFLGSYMDIHDQHIAELRAARQEEIEASEAKHRLLANLIPQIIFTATEDEGITFANEQWLSYTGQSFEDALGLGFMDYVHPEDLAKCRIPVDRPPTPVSRGGRRSREQSPSASTPAGFGGANFDSNIRGVHQALSRNNSSSSSSVYELPTANLTELARQGVIKVTTDSNGRLSYTTEIRLRSKAGEYRWHLIRCVEIDNIDFGNGASSYFGSATDINDHKLLETKLKEAMESKGRFLSNMSHEIRTPLVGISGMVSFLQDTTLNEEQRDYTNTIQTSANSLLMIINDILDLSKVDAGMMKLSYEWFHTRSLIEDVNELVSTMAIAKRLELNYVVEADVPAWVRGDRVRIRQVLLNVIGNAIKFTNQGEVFSRCRVINPPQEANLRTDQIMLEFSIVDTGRGFTQEEAELIFKPFSQIDGSSTRQHGGSGLGLVISRQLVELHGGTMDGTAVLGKGSTFTFTARFGLPTDLDHPDVPLSPREPPPTPKTPGEELPQVFRQISATAAAAAVSNPIRRSPALSPSPSAEADFVQATLGSGNSSNLSVGSYRAQATDRPSISSVNVGLVRFSAAARASGQDLSQMKLEMPSGASSPGSAGSPNGGPQVPTTASDFRPPMYSILIICPQNHSREATTKHIEMTLPKDIPHQITTLSGVEEAQNLIGGDDPVIFTHIVVNLPSAEEIIGLMDRIMNSAMVGRVTIVILSDSVQRQAVTKRVANTKYEEALSEKGVTYVYKPVKPSRFAVIFDPAKERDFSIDRNRSTAQRIVETQKQSYMEVEKRMGNKGYKVLVVEDNMVNQKVLQKYLKKVGVDVEVALDGLECTQMVFSRPHAYYSLILCDLHMPRKDGYQACRGIRDWEASNKYTEMPIIALSANVMSDVHEKCVAAGFSDYVTKPVDFINLSTTLSKFF